MRTLAAGRHPDSFVAGGTVLHVAADSPRRSEDVDLFHDTVEAVERAWTHGREHRVKTLQNLVVGPQSVLGTPYWVLSTEYEARSAEDRQ